jgi:DNA-binding response OmpR family regulator
MNAKPQPVSDPTARALVIEDSEYTAYLLEFVLERARYQVTTVLNGRDAEALLGSAEPPDVVVLDLMLPYVDGFELLTRLRENPRWRDVPVLILSAKSLEGDIVRAFELGANDYVTKPFRPPELLARVNRLVPRAAHLPVARVF